MTMQDLVGYVPIHGTHSRTESLVGDAFYQIGSPFANFMQGRRFRQVRATDPYRWSGHINGAAGVLHRALGRPPSDKGDWHAAGDAFRWWLDGVDFEDTNIIAHSHGVWPVIVGCACDHDPTFIRTLTTIGSPVRSDMRAYLEKARPRIGFWQHVYDSKFDEIGSAGAFGDGDWDWWWSPSSRAQSSAHLNVPLDGIGHSGLLRDERSFPLWVSSGLLANIVAQQIVERPSRIVTEYR